MSETVGITITSNYCPVCNSSNGRYHSAHGAGNECFLCYRQSFLGTHMPYPSRYDGEWICGECVRDILDVTIGSFVERGVTPAWVK